MLIHAHTFTRILCTNENLNSLNVSHFLVKLLLFGILLLNSLHKTYTQVKSKRMTLK
jgi:hypothetical protein